MARAVSTSARCWLNECVLRTVAAINEPMAVRATATTASAINTSRRVKPATACRFSKGVGADNFYASRQPICPNLVGEPRSSETNRTAA